MHLGRLFAIVTALVILALIIWLLLFSPGWVPPEGDRVDSDASEDSALQPDP